MGRQRLLLLVYTLMLGSACLLAYQGWRAASQAVVVVEWETASELNTAGFNLYRSDEQNQDSVRVNETLIPPSGDSLAGGSYRYEDRQVTPGHTYVYELEEVETSGSTSRVGRIEVKARGGGRMEFLMAGLLVVVLLFNVFPAVSRRRAPSKAG